MSETCNNCINYHLEGDWTMYCALDGETRQPGEKCSFFYPKPTQDSQQLRNTPKGEKKNA